MVCIRSDYLNRRGRRGFLRVTSFSLRACAKTSASSAFTSHAPTPSALRPNGGRLLSTSLHPHKTKCAKTLCSHHQTPQPESSPHRVPGLLPQPAIHHHTYLRQPSYRKPHPV